MREWAVFFLIAAVVGFVVLYYVIKAAVRDAINESRCGTEPSGEHGSGGLPQKTCPECGAAHDFDYPACPRCGRAY